MTFGEGFKYSTLCDELVVGEIYVRVYNLQPTFVLEVNFNDYKKSFEMFLCTYLSRMPRDLPTVFLTSLAPMLSISIL